MPSHLNGFKYILPSFCCALWTIVSFITSQPDNLIGREMETAFLIVVPIGGWELKYLHHSVPKESNEEIVFEKQFDFLRFMILNQ